MTCPEVDPRRTVAATTTGDAWPASGHATPGAVFLDAAGAYGAQLLFACPGCGRMGGIPVWREKKAGRRGWLVTAGEPLAPETLSLAPSIHCLGCCGWHGFLRAGVFESC